MTKKKMDSEVKKRVKKTQEYIDDISDIDRRNVKNVREIARLHAELFVEDLSNQNLFYIYEVEFSMTIHENTTLSDVKEETTRLMEEIILLRLNYE